MNFMGVVFLDLPVAILHLLTYSLVANMSVHIAVENKMDSAIDKSKALMHRVCTRHTSSLH